MVTVPDPGARGLRAVLVLSVLFSTASVSLYISANWLNTWSVAIEPRNANGGLGLHAFCPNTNYFINGTVLTALNATEVNTACVFVDYNCFVRIGYVASTPGGTSVYAYFYYNVFEPQPVTSNDRVYELFKVFPGYGSCQGYRNARFWGGAATIGAFLAVLTSSFGLCVPHNRKKTSSSGTSCVCCAVICGIVTLSVWAGSVVNFQTSTLGSGFWCMVSAIVLGVCSIPCLSAYALVATEAPEFQQPPAGNQYHYQQYQPGQQYQYGTAPGQQYQYGHYPPAPPVARQPPPDYQQYYYQP